MESQLRVSIVSETYLPQINGVSRTLQRLTDYLVGQGDQVQLLIPRYEQRIADQDGVRLDDFSALPLPFYKEVVLPLVRPVTLRQRLQEFKPDLVHIATEGPLGWAALRAAKQLDLPVVSSYHTNFAQYLSHYRLGLLNGACWMYLRRLHNATRFTACPTPSIKKLLEEKGFAQVVVWGRGVYSDDFSPAKRDPELRRELGIAHNETVFIYVGRLAAEKNLEMLLQAWQRIPKEKSCRLVLVGDGPLRKRLEALADERVIFAGYRQGEALSAIFASADLFVFPSLTDTFGNVVLEALASGLPGIAFNVSGPGDIIRHGETGLLVQSVSADDLTESMLCVLAMDPNRLGEMRCKARRYAQCQSWETILGQLRSRYVDVLRQEDVLKKTLGNDALQWS